MSKKSRDARAAARAAKAAQPAAQDGTEAATGAPTGGSAASPGDNGGQPVDADTLALARLIQSEPDLRKKAEELAAQRARDAELAAQTPKFEPGGVDDPRYFWPKSRPLPRFCRKREVIPCKICRRIQLENGGFAVYRTSTRADRVFFRCKSCGKTFDMDVKKD